jgi:hypothetical protein
LTFGLSPRAGSARKPASSRKEYHRALNAISGLPSSPGAAGETLAAPSVDFLQNVGNLLSRERVHSLDQKV